MLPILELLTTTEIMLCSAVILVAAVLQLSAGMGFGMIASPLLAFIKPELVPGMILCMGLTVSLTGAWRERQNIAISELKSGIGGRIVGSLIAFVILLLIPNIDVFQIVFGCIMFVAIALAASGLEITFSERKLFNLSILSGLMGTITAVGAPPMALIYHNRPPKIVRPTLNAFFGSACILGLTSLAFSGWLTLEVIIISLILMPIMIVSIYVSKFLRKVSSIWLSRILLGLSGLASF
ncbi:MAG: sulfite exporter TauE/SafE family protein, partial [Pseudomonadota bacterium]